MFDLNNSKHTNIAIFLAIPVANPLLCYPSPSRFTPNHAKMTTMLFKIIPNANPVDFTYPVMRI